jgi:hypothetical protein
MSAGRLEFVSPRRGLIAAVASRLHPSGRDYSRSWVVFPEKRPAYYLRRALAENAGGAIIPPRADSLDAFVDKVFGERLGLGGRPIGAMDAAALLFDLHRGAPDRLGRESFLDADQFFPLGVKIFRDLEEIEAAGATKEDLIRVDALGDEAIPEETRERLQKLSYFHENFYDRLSGLGLTTPASRLRTVAARLDPRLFDDIDDLVLAGFFSLSKLEIAVAKTILGWPNSRLILLKGAGIEKVLDDLAIEDPGIRAAAMAPDPGPETHLTFTKSPDVHGQLAALNAALSGRLEDPGKFNERQVIVLPAAETLFPLYQQTLAALGEGRFNISLGYPLARTPVASFFERLLEVVQSMDDGRVYAPHYLRLVLHPYAKNFYFPGLERRADLTRILIHAVEDVLVRRRTKVFWSLAELEEDADIRTLVQERTAGVEGAPAPAEFLAHLAAIHAAILAPFRSIRDVGDFAAKLSGVLDHIYEHSTARLHYFFHPYAEAFTVQLEELSRSLLRTLVFRDPASYVSLLRKIVASASVPFLGTPLGGLQVLGFWETRGIPFEEVFLLDANEGILPSFSRSDSLLPAGVRQALGLPTYRDQERRLGYHLDALIRGAGEVHVFFVDNDEREPSRFVERLLWEAQKKEGEKTTGRFVRSVEYRVDLAAADPAPVPKTPAVADFLRGLRYSATALDTYLQCPLRFYHAYVLGLSEKEEVAERMEKKDIGTFVHAVLEEFFRPAVGRPLGPQDLDSGRMAGLIERKFAEAYGADAGGAAFLMKLQTRRHLIDFLTCCQEPLVAGLSAAGESLIIQGLEREIAAERGGFKLRARIDRTEKRGEALFVLDYKTSHQARPFGIDFEGLDLEDRATWGRAAKSLQLPLYSLILAQSHGLPPHAIHVRFVLLGRNRLGPEIEFSPFDGEAGDPVDPEVRRERVDAAGRLIDRLLAEIVDPRRPFSPSPEDDGACRFCPFTGICGRA